MRERLKCKWDPSVSLPCFKDHEPTEHECVMCQLHMIRGTLYRLTKSLESSRGIDEVTHMRSKFGELSDEEEKFVRKLAEAGIPLGEIFRRFEKHRQHRNEATATGA